MSSAGDEVSAERARAAPRQRAPYPVAARRLLRETVFGAARDQLQQRSWAQITMADIAGAAGVSRQTLYKQFGSRDEFGQAFVIHESERFLDSVEKAIGQHLDDPRAAVSSALELFLRSAREDPMVRALLRDDGTGGALPLLTTRGMPLLRWATDRLCAAIREGWPQVPEDDVSLLADSLVRLAISYMTAPGGPPRAAALAAGRLLGPFIDRALGVNG